ncbi:cytochrome P450 monooxygenase 39 [Heterobasidion irregulare TC 32-1]|uniref:Cytochrome P450 monooxygenase 39 n=1 Tax=Heterobasidion irregulare (strain TC 32-1) TaxID=747525 RepID=W4JU54_HETIT|nr:cytochrome P450 monooxygenase 39 [Heterobasidion irregulare TC 32-1]ETW76401.1 cytochrome P450 monooxygenase 39 [Heterobasidion irregulare TC 32-1]
MWIPSDESDKLANSGILLFAARIRRMFSITPSALLGCKEVAIMRTHGLPIRLPLPPGPRGLPIFGNFLDVPRRAAWETYADWARRYGDIMSVRIVGQTFVIINSVEIARELLEQRSSVYSDRPVIPSHELMQYDLILSNSGFGQWWKSCRRIIDRSFRQRTAITYRSIQTRKSEQFLRKLAHKPNDVVNHITHLSASAVMSIIYGLQIADYNDHYVALAEDTNKRGSIAAIPGGMLINAFPILNSLPAWFPGMSFKNDVLTAIQQIQEAANAPFDFVKYEMQKGTAEPSFVLQSLDPSAESDNNEIDEKVIKFSALSLYLGEQRSGTVSILSTFFMVLVLYPSVQERAQAEVDAIVGRKRLPEFDDRPHMPYIDAICRELLRWRMVTPMAVPHATTEDDTYGGYFIPKGSQVIVNSWSILHNPAVYPDPDVFRPERFLAPDGSVVEDPNLISAFGFGRRICPGRFFADATIWKVVSAVISTFTVKKATDTDGNEVPVKVEFTDDRLLCHPLPFQCSISPRDKQAEALIAQIEP